MLAQDVQGVRLRFLQFPQFTVAMLLGRCAVPCRRIIGAEVIITGEFQQSSTLRALLGRAASGQVRGQGGARGQRERAWGGGAFRCFSRPVLLRVQLVPSVSGR